MLKCRKIYTSDMPLFVYVQLKTGNEPVRLRANSLEEDDDSKLLIAKDDMGKKIGQFRMYEVSGWWIQDEGPDTEKAR